MATSDVVLEEIVLSQGELRHFLAELAQGIKALVAKLASGNGTDRLASELADGLARLEVAITRMAPKPSADPLPAVLLSDIQGTLQEISRALSREPSSDLGEVSGLLSEIRDSIGKMGLSSHVAVAGGAMGGQVKIIAPSGQSAMDNDLRAVRVTSVDVGGGVIDTELPAAAALADGAANPTTPTVGAAALVWNGTSFDRVRGDTANGADVDVTRLPSGTVAGAASLPAGTNNIGDVDVLTLPASTVAGSSSIPAGTNMMGFVKTQGDLTGLKGEITTTGGSISQGIPAHVTAGLMHAFDGVEWIRWQGSAFRSIALGDSSRTATAESGVFGVGSSSGLLVFWVISSVSGAASLTLKVVGNDGTATFAFLSYDVFTSAAVTAAGTKVYRIGSGITETANVTKADLLPYFFKIRVEHATADAVQYYVGINLVP